MKYTKEYWDWNNSQDDLLIKRKTDNKLIAEFMGVEEAYNPNGNDWVLKTTTPDAYGDTDILESCKDNELQYHSSWDWLMPVVEKIECTKTDDEDNSDSFFNVMIEVFECNINGRDICICENGNTKLEATYRAVVKFINQYNKI